MTIIFLTLNNFHYFKLRDEEKFFVMYIILLIVGFDSSLDVKCILPFCQVKNHSCHLFSYAVLVFDGFFGCHHFFSLLVSV